METPLRINHRPVRTVSDVVRELGVDPRQIAKAVIFKVEGDRLGHVMAVVPGDARVAVDRLAALTGAHRIRLEPAPEKVCGMPIGGISPLGLAGRLRTIVDARLAEQEEVYVGGGSVTASLVLSGDLLVLLACAQVGDIAEPR